MERRGVHFDDTAKPKPCLTTNFLSRTRNVLLPYPIFFVVCRQIDICQKNSHTGPRKKKGKIKGRASKVFCPGYQVIVCSVEKTKALVSFSSQKVGRKAWGQSDDADDDDDDDDDNGDDKRCHAWCSRRSMMQRLVALVCTLPFFWNKTEVLL